MKAGIFRNTKKQKILYAVLDWGIGHATRSVPLIKRLLQEGHEVILAAGNRPAAFLKQEFPDIRIIPLPGYGILYHRRLPVTVMMLIQAPKILYRIFQEHQWLKSTCRELQVDTVYSDNCYGLWNRNVHTVFITHQVMIKCPRGWKFLEPLLHRMVLFFIKRFDECLVPDLEGEGNLSGDLSHKYPLPANARFAGVLSRFSPESRERSIKKQWDVCFLISGPEPQRTVFENSLSGQIENRKIRTVLVRGLPEEKAVPAGTEYLTIHNNPDSAILRNMLLGSRLIICRPGYSTLMDLVTLGLGAVLVPTPGQTEQEYLADYHSGKGDFSVIRETPPDLTKLLDALEAASDSAGSQNDPGSSDDVTLVKGTVV